eukprot:1632166-Prymnesium_polylepis.1
MGLRPQPGSARMSLRSVSFTHAHKWKGFSGPYFASPLHWWNYELHMFIMKKLLIVIFGSNISNLI